MALSCRQKPSQGRHSQRLYSHCWEAVAFALGCWEVSGALKAGNHMIWLMVGSLSLSAMWGVTCRGQSRDRIRKMPTVRSQLFSVCVCI